MRNPADEWTDEEFEKLRKLLEDNYREASEGVMAQLESMLADYDRHNVEWQARVASGAVSEAEYREWLGRRATDQSIVRYTAESLANDAVNADRKAMDLINNAIPSVFAENANMAAFAIDSAFGQDHSFDLYDEDTVRRLMLMDEHDQLIHEFIPVGPTVENLQTLRVDLDAVKDVNWNRQKFTSSITQSILQGESIPDAARRLSRVLNMDMNMATRAARTAITGAENAGRVDSYRRAVEMGLKIEQEWMATLDKRTRHSHRAVDGEHVPVGKKFIVGNTELEYPADPKGDPSETYNCFVEGTLACSDTAIERSYRHKYSGELVTVKTASGIEFTCTPNHPILTMSGWVAANLLHEGDNLCIARIGDSRLSGVNPDVNHVQSSMEAIHNLLALHASKRVAGSDVNFHGDIPATDVEIVGKKGTLRFDVETSRGEDIAELPLELSDSTGLRFCPTCESVGSVMTSSTSNLCSKSIFPSLLGCQFAHPHIHGIRTTAPFDPSIAEHPSDNIAGMSDAFGDSFLGVATEIGVDYIVNVEITHTRGTHVYNLQTESGYYFVGSKNTDNVIIAHNCRCTLVAWFPDSDQRDAERWSDLPDGMTYDEWKTGKERS